MKDISRQVERALKEHLAAHGSESASVRRLSRGELIAVVVAVGLALALLVLLTLFA